MASVVRSWVFASDSESLIDSGNNASITFAWLSSDGSPSNGCVRFTAAANSINGTEYAYMSPVSNTWETWGVPAGATVTSFQCTAWRSKIFAFTNGTSNNFFVGVVSTGGANVNASDDYSIDNFSLPTTTSSSWTTQSAGTDRSVDSGFQASNTPVSIILAYTLVTPTGGGTPSIDARFDSIDLTITYTPAPPIISNFTVAMSQP